MSIIHDELNKLGSNVMTPDAFLSIVRKYTSARKLTPPQSTAV